MYFGAGRKLYQLAAIMGFPSGLMRFDLGLCLTLGLEERFFFFCNSRPMTAVLNGLLCVSFLSEADDA